MTNFRTNSFSFFNKYSDILYLLLPNHMLLRSPTRQLHRTCVYDILKNTFRRSSTGERAVDMTFITLQESLPMVADCWKTDRSLHPTVVLLTDIEREQWSGEGATVACENATGCNKQGPLDGSINSRMAQRGTQL